MNKGQMREFQILISQDSEARREKAGIKTEKRRRKKTDFHCKCFRSKSDFLAAHAGGHNHEEDEEGEEGKDVDK